MEKYESLVVNVFFDLIGMSVCNRQQLIKITRKEVGENVLLREGEFFYYESTKYKITNLKFRLFSEKISDKDFKVFSSYENNSTNCEIRVLAEIVE